MTDARGPFDATRLRSELIRGFHAVWDRLRSGRIAPSRRDFGPQDFRFALPHMTLVDVEPPGPDGAPRLRHRLIGTALETRLGRGLTGLPILADGTGEAGMLYADYRSCATLLSPCHAYLRFRFGPDRSSVFERLVLPLSSDGETADMLTACVIFDDFAKSDQFRSWTP